jgi:hypothetical protein
MQTKRHCQHASKSPRVAKQAARVSCVCQTVAAYRLFLPLMVELPMDSVTMMQEKARY